MTRILDWRWQAALACAACSTGVGAVRVNPDGHGQVLIYPYYTARSIGAVNTYVTAFSIVNTSDGAKALKVRLHEAKVGADVLAFNLFLDARDSWTGGVVSSGAHRK